MRKFLHKAHQTLSATTYQIPTSTNGLPTTFTSTPPPTPLSILRHRLHHGTNLGSIYVLEKWLFPHMFESSATGDSELDAVTASIAAIGTEATRQRWEQHWATALSDHDIEFLAYTAHITTLRLPIGYFTLGPRFTASTPFSPSAIASIYTSAWASVLSLCTRLHSAGIGVLIDLHAVPGGANTEDHGGVSTHVAEMWGSEGYRRLAKECLVYIAEEVKKDNIRGCAGIELCNEACWGTEGMYEWYEDVIRAIGAVDASIPLYISDGWDLGRAVEWCAGMNSTSGGGNPVVVDTHKYYAFTDQDRAQGPGEISERVRSEMDDVGTVTGNVLENGAVGVVIGEWSCAMDGNTWVKAGEGVDRDEMVRQFGKTQCEQWRKKAGGSFFWTAKMQWMDGGEWGLFEMVKKGAVVAPAYMTMSFADVKLAAERARRQRLDRKQRAVDAHVTYWDSTALGGKFEHWRFEQGWDLGFADALAFFEMRTNDGFQGAKTGADSIGCLELWILKRARETGQMGGFTWEWEHGFRQGVSGFADSVLVLE